jgi:hypothetical protein
MVMRIRAEVRRAKGRGASAAMAACAFAVCALGWSGSAQAQTSDLSRVLQLIEQQEQRLDTQERQLREQQRQLAEQRSLIERQRREIEAMAGGVSDSELGEIRGVGIPNNSLAFTPLEPDQPIAVNRRRSFTTLAQAEGGSAPLPAAASTAAPAGPVGEAPPEQPHPATQVEALPEGQSALAGRGKLVIEPSFDYSRSSSNRLVFRGVEILPSFQVGIIEASDTARDTLAASVSVRYSLTDRLEIEGRIPYVYRSDRITTLLQREESVSQTFELDGGDVGDVEMSARYQINSGRNGAPIFVAGGRIKSDTGKGPFDLARDLDGVATELATGSGFWGAQASVSVLYPSDPAVLFANLSYLYNMPRDIDRTVGGVDIGEVDPGDSIGAGFGFGFALNPRFSYSLGYSHSFIMPTESELGATRQRSASIQVGSLQLGMSFRASERLTIATSVDIGATEDAPDVRIGLRMPYRF